MACVDNALGKYLPSLEGGGEGGALLEIPWISSLKRIERRN